MESQEYFTSMEPTALREHVEGFFAHHRYQLRWNSDWDAAAERGSKIKTLLIGAFAEPHMKLNLQIAAGVPGQTVLRISKENSGWMAGAIGAHKNNKAWTDIQHNLGSSLHQLGALPNM